MRRFVLAVVLSGCGVSAVQLRDETQGQTRPSGLDIEGPGAPMDAGVPGCATNTQRSCTTSCGSLSTQRCEAGRWSACQPPVETCGDGVDNDCDELTDARDPDCPSQCVANTRRTCTASCGVEGVQRCEGGGWTHCEPGPERCGDGLDNDCDGRVDANDSDCPSECVTNTRRSCTTSCGVASTQLCENGAWARCEPVREVCTDGVDNDCDGAVDGADSDCPGQCVTNTRRSCTTSCGVASTQLCENGAWARCEPVREVCTDGVDNDCDGHVDARDTDCPPTRYRCEDAEGNGCNGDLGYGDHCAPQDNTNGCSASRFHAWCNRRNPAYPGIWDNWVRGWVDSRCDGTVQETGTQYSTWYCVSSANDRFECTTPLVLVLDGAPVRFLASPGRFAFTPSRPVTTDWPLSATPWLARDLDGDGRIDSGRELFGSDTLLPGGGVARQGFEALEALDENHDGLVDARDPAFAELLLWRDVNGDRRSDAAELERLSTRVSSLSTSATPVPRCDRRGNCERERGTVTLSSGVHAELVDVYLRVQPGVSARQRPRR
jgi:hypothetical protein